MNLYSRIKPKQHATAPLTFSVNNVVKRTSIRVSEEAKKSLSDYDFVKKNAMTIL